VNVLAAILLASTSLHIGLSNTGDRMAKTYTLRCDPAGGTLPQPARACRRLAQLKDPFAPTPKGTVCTQIYGGPQIAFVTGRFRGRSVRAHFNRKNGCEIARWNRVRFLFPAT
jgi:aminoglycoside phosphotransferase (APT) family kinase protein